MAGLRVTKSGSKLEGKFGGERPFEIPDGVVSVEVGFPSEVGRIAAVLKAELSL
jgi:hypothetical protein